MKILYFRSIALVGALCSISLNLLAVPTREVATVRPGKVLDVGTMKPLFKKTNRVAVVGYNVSFVTRNKATAHAMNLLGSGTAKSSLETFLGNVDYALMQEIADAGLADFVKRLEQAGLEVVPAETVRSAAAYRELETVPASAEQAHQVQFQGAHYLVVPAGGMPLWFNKYDGLGGKKASGKNVKVMAQLAKELDAAVLQPSLAMDFAYLDTSGGKFARRASVDAQNGMLIVPAASVFWGSTEGLTYTKFVDGFWAEGGTGTWVEAKNANNVALVKGLASAGIDIGPVTRKKAIVLEADRGLFKEKSIELLSGANEIYRRGIAEVTKR